MIRKLLFASATALCATANAQTPDWATKVAPILYNHCTSCHHDGGIAPFSLISYSDAVLNAGSIRSDVTSKKMPPWPPDPIYGRLAHERILSAADIATIAAWVDGGTPQGTPSLAPPPPTYSNTGMISGTPDLVVKIPTYTSTASTGDVYQCFVIPSGLVTDKFIQGFEAIPGNPACVHHVLVFADTTGKCATLDAGFPGPGYPNFWGAGTDSATMLGVWVPGSQPMTYPNGFGLKLPHNADIVVQVHYPAGTTGMVDSTEIHFFFAPSAGVREVFMQPILYHDFDMLNGPLHIPANTVKTFYEEFSPVPLNISLLGVFPHMHLIGKSIESYAILPSGDTDKYIRINNWDFHWQGFYMFRKLRLIPAGSKLRATAVYDNTSSNPENPFSPPQDIDVGESTTEEMMIVFYVFTFYQPGDENIIADSTILAAPDVRFSNYYRGQQLLDVMPNPAVNDIIVKCYMENNEEGSMELVDADGRVARRFMTNARMNSGYTAYTWSVDGLPAGNYTLVMRTSQQVISRKLVVVH